jgi:hypothetical protein
MSVKILLRSSSSEICVPVSHFKEVMGVDYIDRIHFITPQVRTKIEKKCQCAYRKKKFGQRQLWLGQYYSRDIAACRIPDITIAWIDDVFGYGVWTNRDIPAFTYIGEYAGILRRPYFFKDRENYYCFSYYITMNYWERNLWAPYLIDSKEEGNFIRYINHSDQPNLDMASAYHGGVLHIIFYAKTFIPKGTQLGYDYGPIYWEKRKKPLPLSNDISFMLK